MSRWFFLLWLILPHEPSKIISPFLLTNSFQHKSSLSSYAYNFFVPFWAEKGTCNTKIETVLFSMIRCDLIQFNRNKGAPQLDVLRCLLKIFSISACRLQQRNMAVLVTCTQNGREAKRRLHNTEIYDLPPVKIDVLS